ncbi:hypothetical protein LO772_16530 [Yinghuangia sp. ASG 101]|uniref:hypothetical protein n=1 Tax=Yinghuangia sp. ASG 101 TaxID=2896848 RepID=UPI001E4072AF|nr:hypothetical protein [Yinghuangia sp. ASG 101]UGQ15024.1 hypothetical protein LO772_16530 [Yinghuangia sp. ASG 101]
MSARNGRVADRTGDTAVRFIADPAPIRSLVEHALSVCNRRDDRKGADLMRHRLARCTA